MDPGAISIADKIIDRHGLAGVMILVLLVILWLVWRELVQTRRDATARADARADKDSDQRDAATRADVEATGAFRDVGRAVTGLESRIEALRSDLTRGRP